ncbi:hypothetical protein DGo_CA2150 [Deinococcus gobiensis I-0]|uniref:Uncharacterized protein n=1 Tax=Deinococcus gobiensis (strain DSM 21396 / JCM 16679 / CGMCC 1.7299 / I-0) TaxID=745776 RepID=H8GYN0_DEIGI|nr:hypothetical protein DGo_CA2150 [Deinococcus gobiensis I-0]
MEGRPPRRHGQPRGAGVVQAQDRPAVFRRGQAQQLGQQVAREVVVGDQDGHLRGVGTAQGRRPRADRSASPARPAAGNQSAAGRDPGRRQDEHPSARPVLSLPHS